ncbi:hypothetical protein EDB86DRAFT_2947203 [Lactarius hatsudake]|nr:hypothetical protein EDB86DRAFT_2947203 [Lactarius hatsudake]
MYVYIYCTFVHLAALSACLLRQRWMISYPSFLGEVNAGAKVLPSPTCASQAGKAEWNVAQEASYARVRPRRRRKGCFIWTCNLRGAL